jgi:hypothetical protein
LPFLGGACCALLKLKRESFHADEKEEEINGAQDGCEEARAQSREEEESREEEAESETESRLVQAL